MERLHGGLPHSYFTGSDSHADTDDRRQLWDQLHAGGAQDRLSPFLAAAWAQCASMGVKPDLDALPCLPPEQFEEAKWNAIRGIWLRQSLPF